MVAHAMRMKKTYESLLLILKAISMMSTWRIASNLKVIGYSWYSEGLYKMLLFLVFIQNINIGYRILGYRISHRIQDNINIECFLYSYVRNASHICQFSHIFVVCIYKSQIKVCGFCQNLSLQFVFKCSNIYLCITYSYQSSS